MKHALKLEAIGYTSHMLPSRMIGCDRWLDPRRPWVAECRLDLSGRIGRAFLRPNYDWKGANGRGTRGIMAWFWLDEGKVYEVRCYSSWRCEDRYFAFCDASGIGRISTERAMECLRSAA